MALPAIFPVVFTTVPAVLPATITVVAASSPVVFTALTARQPDKKNPPAGGQNQRGAAREKHARLLTPGQAESTRGLSYAPASARSSFTADTGSAVPSSCANRLTRNSSTSQRNASPPLALAELPPPPRTYGASCAARSASLPDSCAPTLRPRLHRLQVAGKCGQLGVRRRPQEIRRQQRGQVARQSRRRSGSTSSSTAAG
jgi:hypothetical protein